MNSGKILLFDVNKCTGCRTCEIRCSFKHFRVVNPLKSRIRIIKLEGDGINIPMVCNQCEEAPCMEVCPTKAIQEDKNTGARIIEESRCLGCKSCVHICPFGAMTLTREKKLIKCTLCDGDPDCAKHCETGALIYTKVEKAGASKRHMTAKKLARFLK